MKCWLGFIDNDNLCVATVISGSEDVLPFIKKLENDETDYSPLMYNVFNTSHRALLDTGIETWKTLRDTKAFIAKHEECDLPIMFYHRTTKLIYIGAVDSREFETYKTTVEEAAEQLCKFGYFKGEVFEG